MTVQTTAAAVAPLSAFGASDLALAGGKGANLGELVRAGFAVPDGFVVTTDAYAAHTVHTGLSTRITERLAAGETDGAAIRAEFAATEVSGELRAAIAQAYAGLGQGPVAVRSSATAEDLPGAAFAGQQDTYLGVLGTDAVVDAVLACWGSLWTERAIAYRTSKGIEQHDVRIAVVVQRMVDAAAAGVMFTANPINGARDETVVDAAGGLGEAVVSGSVTPDHYVVGPRGVDKQLAGAQVLDDLVITELARLGRAIAVHFGRPQDIEWAYRDGKLWILQARPMTALPPPPIALNRVQRKIGSVTTDYFSLRPYPIDMSTWVAHGPMDMVVKMARSVGIEVDFSATLPEEDGVVTRFVPPQPRPTPRLLGAPFRLARRIRRFDPAKWTDDARYADFERRNEALDALELTALSWRELLRVPRQALALVDVMTQLRIDYLPSVGVALLRLRLALAVLHRGALAADLFAGAPTRTRDANQALAALAERVRATPELHAAFADLEPDQLLPKVREFAEFDAALRAFLAEYGHRETASPVLMTPPTWDAAPEIVLGLVKSLATESTGQDSDRSTETERKLLAHPLLGTPRRQQWMRRTVRAARIGIALREDTHFAFTRSLPALRRSVLEMGRRLCDAGVLTAPEDVFHLRLEELEAIDDVATLSAAATRRLRDTADQRAAKRAELAGVPLIDLRAVFGTPSGGPDAVVAGTPASAGQASGPVRVIHEPAEFGTLRGGDVLVCPYTNPAWTPLFQRAAAVVVDTGGMGSHAAIVAREYGIPAVMGTGDATAVLRDGQLVTVDGNTGQVTLAAG